MATAARGLLRTVVLPPPGPCGRNATYPGNRVDDRLSAPAALSGRRRSAGGVREIIAIGPSSLQRLTIFGRDRRDSGRFWRTLEMSKLTTPEVECASRHSRQPLIFAESEQREQSCQTITITLSTHMPLSFSSPVYSLFIGEKVLAKDPNFTYLSALQKWGNLTSYCLAESPNGGP